MLTPTEIWATASAGIAASTPAMRTFETRTLERSRIPKVFNRNHLSGTVVPGSGVSGLYFSVTRIYSSLQMAGTFDAECEGIDG
jgi:hypothetical protein